MLVLDWGIADLSDHRPSWIIHSPQPPGIRLHLGRKRERAQVQRGRRTEERERETKVFDLYEGASGARAA